MTKQIASFVVVLLTVLPGVGATSHARTIGPQNQFHIQPKKGRSAAYDKLRQRLASVDASRQEKLAKMGVLAGARNSSVARKPKPHRNTPSVAGSVGFVASAQVSAGGFVSYDPVLSGDFNGDGKKDLLTIVCDSSCNLYISASLGNGDGTFQTATLTAIPANSSDAFVVGDVNGDKKDDVIVVHNEGSLGSGAPSSFDVFLSNGDGTFTPGNNYAITSDDLSSGILYDINGDGKLDAVSVDTAVPGNVWVLLGNGDGTFQPATSTVLSGEAGYNLVFADFNGDGLLDFAENDYTTGQMTVYLGMSSDPQFQAAVSYNTSDSNNQACWNAAGDMTGDGMPEIVSSNCADDNTPDDNTITVYVNNGSGTFSQGTYFPVATAPSTGSTAYVYPGYLTVADVNGDGLGDVITTNYATGDVTVLLSNGDGTVKVPNLGYATGGYAPYTAPVVADFNGDGLPDIAVANTIDGFSYMKGYGDGTFQAAVDYYSPTTDNGEAYAFDVATGDFNGDGIPDVVLGNWCCDSTVGITVFLSNGNGTLAPGVNYGSDGYLAYVAVADFNQDGILDIAAVDNLNGLVQIFYGAGTGGVGNGTFTAGPTLATNDTDSERIVAADLNGDGYPDLVVANNNGGTVGVFLNLAGTFQPQVTYTLNAQSFEVAVADVNGDGVPDLLLSEEISGNLAVLLGDPSGNGTFGAETDFNLGNNPVQIAVGDVNGDGKLDVVATMADYVNGMGLAVALGDGQGNFSLANAIPYPTSSQTTYASQYPSQPGAGFVRLLDLNGDGALDAVYTNPNYSTVGIMFGQSGQNAGVFANPTEYPTAEGSYGLAMADVNGDGAIDAVTAGDGNSWGFSEATVLLNNSGTAELPNYSLSASANVASVNAGQNVPITFTLTPRNFYNGTVTFACSGLPSLAQCTFSNPSLTPNGNAAMTTMLTITTTAPSTSMVTPMTGNPWTMTGNTNLLASFGMLGMFGLMLAAGSKKNRRLATVVGALVLGAMIVTVGCGGNSSSAVTPPQQNPGTPSGTYAVTVTATGTAGTNGGNTSAHVVTVNLTVQ